MPDDDYFLEPSLSRAEEEAREMETQKRSVAALAAIADPLLRELAAATDAFLAKGLGGPSGYFPSPGAPATRRLQEALQALGIVPDYGASTGYGCRPAAAA